MTKPLMTLDQVQALLERGPFHRWLGLKAVAVGADSVELLAPWREEWVVNPERRYTHGGILATLIDTAGDYAIAAATGKPVPTIDMRVDYHRAAMPGDLTARGRVVKLGSSFSTAEASVFDQEGMLVASGRGVYFTAPPKS